ncbi:hypothetical protein LOTGIDRAFT_172897 [Lottia gigantea]|uniref:BTB domain-containing protein n=1 Tax=Lottia gigantea TaxID=225164 RepID=V4AUI0_LOTGI|nr:hypothetical protein LOTGIDRAFT_172897 [Lottia gigantea]ESP00968.1 hypothetical protein LOTGIDRAFT_172897 [Lottia gigantea]
MPMKDYDETDENVDIQIEDMNSDLNEKVTFNVGGKTYVTLKHTLINIPTTKLGKLTKEDPSYDGKRDEYFFDRNGKIFQSVLDLHRTGELHLPSDVCSTSVRKELEFWRVPEDYISECCWKSYSLQNQDLKIAAIIDERMGKKFDETNMNSHTTSCRQKLWLTLEHPNLNLLAKVWHFVYIAFVLLSIIVFCLSTIPEFRIDDVSPSGNASNPSTNASDPFYNLTHTHPVDSLYYLDIVCMVFFMIELPLRMLICPDKREFFRRGLNKLDIFLMMVMITAFGIDMSPAFKRNDPILKEVETVIRLFLGLRVFRIFHLARRYPTIKILYLTIKASLRELLLLLVGLTMAVMIFATFVFLAESLSHSASFKSVPYAIWWAIITMTTVGYGDYYPVTFAGHLVGICCALSGLLLLSMPIAIIAQNFNAYYSNLTVREERALRENKRKEMRVKNAAESLRMKLAVRKLFHVSQKMNNTISVGKNENNAFSKTLNNNDPSAVTKESDFISYTAKTFPLPSQYKSNNNPKPPPGFYHPKTLHVKDIKF